MSKLDQFESAFRSAAKPRFHRSTMELGRIAVVTDYPQSEAQSYRKQVQAFLSRAFKNESIDWVDIAGDSFNTVGELLEQVKQAKPDLICTYRHLHSEGWKWPFSLGEYLDVLTQATPVPVLALPHPRAERAAGHSLQNTDNVMAITDHLTGSDSLVNAALRFTQSDGTLWLTHIEDESAFDHIMETISKIPSIDTEHARQRIRAQLLKEPHDYIVSCQEELKATHCDIELRESIRMGHHLSTYKALVEEHKVDLLVMNTKDHDQFAMHGMAYPLAVELRQIPLLLL